MKLHYQEVSLDTVMNFYADAFEVETSRVEWFIDQSKNTVIFKMFIKDTPVDPDQKS